MEGFAFFGFLAPILGGLFGGGAAAGLAGSVLTAGLGYIGQRKEAKRQEAAANAQAAAVEASEAKSQEAYRNQLRTKGRGTGDFVNQLGNGGSLATSLKGLTGQ